MRIVIKNANVFDGRLETLQTGAIVIENSLVKEIVRGNFQEDSFGTVIDAQNKTVIPGLTDAHVHLFFTGNGVSDTLRVDEKAVRSVRFARDMLLRGFTTVRDAGGIVYGLKKNIDDGYLVGPRILPSNAFISQTSGHGDTRLSRAEERLADGYYASANIQSRATVIADGVAEVTRAVREQLFLGASQIKIMAGGGISSAYDPIQTVQFTYEEMKAAVDAASDYGTYVMAHLYTPQSMQRAARAGVKSFEHASMLDEETAKIVAGNGIWIMPGPQLGREMNFPNIPESILRKAAFVRNGEIIATEMINKYNLPILFGTDSFGDPKRAEAFQLDDFRYFKKRFGSFRGLVAATGNINEIIKLSTYQNPYPDGKIGVLEPGAFADLLIVDGNPVEDLDVLADQDNIRLIMKDAQIYKNTLNSKIAN
jgi:imidazolonepropionase-like amidohydrolase